jgi:mevalonate kinase
VTKAIAPSKIILSGEHFVVEGEPALVAAIDIYAKCIAEERFDESIRIESKDYFGKIHVIKYSKNKIIDYAGDKNTKRILRPVLISVLKTLEYSEQKKGLDIYINSEIPPSAGLGSSAAVAVATSAAVIGEIKGNINKEIIWKAAFEAERAVHKNPSGIDVTISTFGGLILYKKGEKPNFIKLDYKPIFIVGLIGKRAKTGKLVEKVLKLKKEFPSIINPLYISAGNLTIKLVEALKNKDLKTAGLLMNINHRLLSAIGVSTPKLDMIVNTAIKKGAYGAKLTGAGGGGSIIALVDESKLEKVKSSLEKKIKKVYVSSIVEEGVKIV